VAQFRREVVALLRAGHRILGETGVRLVAKYDKFLRDSWRIRRAPCWVSDAIAKKYKESRASRDPENPHEGEVYQSRSGARWRVTSVNATKRRVKVRKSGFRDLGELEWNPSVLRSMKQVPASEPSDFGPLPADRGDSTFKAWLAKLPFPGRVSGDPDRRYRVYVIESLQGRERVFYVGQSAHSPSQRLAQHKAGVSYCKGCTKRSYAHGSKMKLRQDLIGKLSKVAFRTRSEAERAEKMVARMLRGRGFTVEGGH
jgi:hypothetical protein